MLTQPGLPQHAHCAGKGGVTQTLSEVLLYGDVVMRFLSGDVTVGLWCYCERTRD